MRKARLLLLVLLCATNAACGGTPAVLLNGTPKSAEISYRGDLNAAAALARQHCAQYERVARLLAAGVSTAYYNCVRP